MHPVHKGFLTTMRYTNPCTHSLTNLDFATLPIQILITPLLIGKQSNVMSVSVCVRVCLSAIISLELHVRSSPIFVCMLPMAMAQSSSDSIVICCIFPVLWMTSYLHIS